MACDQILLEELHVRQVFLRCFLCRLDDDLCCPHNFARPIANPLRHLIELMALITFNHSRDSGGLGVAFPNIRLPLAASHHRVAVFWLKISFAICKSFEMP